MAAQARYWGVLEARSDAFFVRYGHRPDFSTIFVRCFDENSIDFVERLLDDRRSLDDAFVVPAKMHDIEKTLKNLDRAHKIRVRRCSADPCAKVIWTANFFENASKKRTKTQTAKRSKHLAKIDAQDPRKSISGGVRASQIVVRQARLGGQTPSERTRNTQTQNF